jgi:peptidoglycan/LPS O-acetylase OafA/YrhL
VATRSVANEWTGATVGEFAFLARPTIAERFDPRHNSLNFLRLLLALAVIVSHAWPVGGYGSEPRIAGDTVGTWAVGGFFAISGFLIARSRLHTSFPGFLLRRFLRIYPGYLVCLLVIVLFFAPLSVAIGPGSIDWGSAASYLGGNLFLKIEQNGIADTLTSVPFGDAWNGSLWTLFYEFVCYLLIGVLLTTIPRWHRTVVVAAFLVVAALAALETHRGGSGTFAEFVRLGAIFLGGSVIAVFADRIPFDWRLGVAAWVLLPVTSAAGAASWAGALPMAYAWLWLGIVLPFARVGRRNDISYGVYIYAFPVQQTLVLLHVNRLPVTVSILLEAAVTVPLAAASWFLVEKRALTLKSRRAAPHPRHAVQALHPNKRRVVT